MNFKDTIEFAATISAHSQHLMTPSASVSSTALGQYWKLQRSALNRQHQEFSRMQQYHREYPHDKSLAEKFLDLIEEITNTEIIQRTWATILTIQDQQLNRQANTPIVRNLHLSLLELRKLLLKYLLSASSENESILIKADRQRRRAENWTNFVCGHLVIDYGIVDYVHSESEARSYDLEHLYYLLSRELPRIDKHRRQETLKCGDFEPAFKTLDYLLATDIFPQSANASVDAIAGSILTCFPYSAFNEHGRFKPIKTLAARHQRILQIAAQE